MSAKLVGFLVTIGGILFYAFMIASLIKLDASLAVKLIIACLFYLMYWVIRSIGEVSDRLDKMILFARLSFISIETFRLKFKNRTSAWDLLVDDIKLEKTGKEIEREAEGYMGPAIRAISSAVSIGFLLFAVSALLVFWDILEEIAIKIVS